jgi:hypothetical protein
MPTTTKGLTPYELQTELKVELEELFKDTYLKNAVGDLTPPKIHIHDLPVPMTDDDSELSEMPYIIIRTTGGKIRDWDSFSDIKELTVLLLIGVYNPDPQRTGHADVLNMIQRIENHLGRKRRVGNFAVGSSYEFVTQESDTHPYYFGGITLTFEAARTIKEDPLV